NIKTGHEKNFIKLLEDENMIYMPFDYDSNMQYGSLTFSRDGTSPTMTPKKEGVELKKPKHKNGLSEYDAISINKMYKCY
ncbi:myosinase-III-like protein, partial [Leptotrombidium deliense]